MQNYEKQIQINFKSKSREVEHNLFKIEKDSCKNFQENLKLAMKKTTTGQATYQKELCLLFEKSGSFFHRGNVQIGLTPFLLFVFVCFLHSLTP